MSAPWPDDGVAAILAECRDRFIPPPAFAEAHGCGMPARRRSRGRSRAKRGHADARAARGRPALARTTAAPGGEKDSAFHRRSPGEGEIAVIDVVIWSDIV
jgi:hypothetical protein